MIISIMNWKGGQGKTTTVFQLSLILSSQGYKVLAVDLDGQGSLTNSLVKNVTIKGYLPDYFFNPEEEHDLILTHSKNLDFIANERRRSVRAAKVLPSQDRGGQEVLRDLLDQYKDEYDIIFIDCPPSFDILTENALVASDRILIPTELTTESLDGMVSLIREVKKMVDKDWNAALRISGVFIFRPKLNTKYHRQAKEFLKSIAGNKLLNTSVRENIKVPESVAHGVSILEHAPNSNGAIDYEALAKELVQIESIKKS